MRLFILVTIAACGRLGFDPLQPNEGSDPLGPDASDVQPHQDWDLGAFSPPSVVSEISLSQHEHAGSMTTDLLEVVFESRKAGNDDAWFARRDSPTQPWGPPQRIAELSTGDVDSAFQVSGDGLSMWFTRRDVLYETSRERRTDPWRPPTVSPVMDRVGGKVYVASPTPSKLALVVEIDRPGGSDSDLYLTRRPDLASDWGALEPIAGINTDHEEMKGQITDDLRSMFFVSNRETGENGEHDFYFATRESADVPFGRIERVVELSQPGFDNDPWISYDGHVILFASDRGDDRALYEARR